MAEESAARFYDRAVWHTRCTACCGERLEGLPLRLGRDERIERLADLLGFGRSQLSNEMRRSARVETIGRYIFIYDRVCADHRVVADVYARCYDDVCADDDVIADHDLTEIHVQRLPDVILVGLDVFGCM